MLPGISLTPWWTNFSAFCPLSPCYLQTALCRPHLTFLLSWPLWSVKEPLLFQDTSSLFPVFLSLFSSNSFTGACSIQSLHASAFGGMESHTEVCCLPNPHCLPWDCGSPCYGNGAQLVSKDSCSLIHATEFFVHLGKEMLGSAAYAHNWRKSHFCSFFLGGHHCSSASFQLYFNSCKKHSQSGHSKEA